MADYPIKVRFPNDSAACGYFVTRELEALKGTPHEKRDITGGELELVSKATVGRQKTNVVIENDRERELVVDQLKAFRNGIASEYGAKWAKPSHRKMIDRVVNEIENA